MCSSVGFKLEVNFHYCVMYSFHKILMEKSVRLISGITQRISIKFDSLYPPGRKMGAHRGRDFHFFLYDWLIMKMASKRQFSCSRCCDFAAGKIRTVSTLALETSYEEDMSLPLDRQISKLSIQDALELLHFEARYLEDTEKCFLLCLH